MAERAVLVPAKATTLPSHRISSDTTALERAFQAMRTMRRCGWGRTEESLTESRLSIELDPLNPAMVEHLGWHCYYARQYDQAIEKELRSLEMDAISYRAHETLGRAYEQKGMHAHALAALEKAVTTSKEASLNFRGK